MDDQKKSILNEISNLTHKINREYPELQKYLNETPMTVPSDGETDLSIADLKKYKETLTELIEKGSKAV